MSPGLEELIYSCEFKLAWFAEYCLSQGDTPPNIYGRFSVSDDPVRVAQVMRSGFTTRPLSAALEETRAVIMRSFEPGFHSFTIADNGFLLICMSIEARETQLGHVMIGELGLCGEHYGGWQTERWCDRFATELSPSDDVLIVGNRFTSTVNDALDSDAINSIQADRLLRFP